MRTTTLRMGARVARSFFTRGKLALFDADAPILRVEAKAWVAATSPVCTYGWPSTSLARSGTPAVSRLLVSGSTWRTTRMSVLASTLLRQDGTWALPGIVGELTGAVVVAML